MAEMNIDGVEVNVLVSAPATIGVDEVTVTAVTRLAALTQFRRTPRVELLEALSNSTGVVLDPAKYNIGPVVNTDPPTAKATIDLIALEVSGKRRSTPVVYRRRFLTELITTLDMDLVKPTTAHPITTLAGIVAAINRIHGTTLTVADFEDLPIVPGVDYVLKAAPTSHYFVPGSTSVAGRFDGKDREYELLLRGLNWPTKTAVAQTAFFDKDTFRVEYNKLFNDTYTKEQTTLGDVSEVLKGVSSNRDRQMTLTFKVGEVTTTKVVYFFRLNLAELPTSGLVRTNLWDLYEGSFHDPANVAELATLSGLPIDQLEFANTPLVETTPGGNIDVVFKAKDDSKFFKGEVKVSITRAPRLETILPHGSAFSL